MTDFDGSDIYTLQVEERVDNGIRWLNENFEGWRDRINLTTLTLSDPKSCICGQVFADEPEATIGGYRYAYDHLFSEANSWIETVIPMDIGRQELVAIYLGFESAYESYLELEGVWREKLGDTRKIVR